MKAFDLTLTPSPDLAPTATDSYFWDAPLLTKGQLCPMGTYTDEEGHTGTYPLQFIAQLNLAQLPPSVLPATGLLQLWGTVDYFMGYDTPLYNGLGWWPNGAVLAHYTPCPDVARLVRTNPFDEEGTVVPHRVRFAPSDSQCDGGFRLLGAPYEDDVRQEVEDTDWTLLLQMDSTENEYFDLQFHDMGLLYLFIERQRLACADFSHIRAYMTSM